MINSPQHHPVLRVVTWNSHKGVQGLGPAQRLEIHHIGRAIEQLDTDLGCLQQVRLANCREARHLGVLPVSVMVPQGRIWKRMSDHFPLVAELGWLD